jgi:hypothetical protein
VRSVCFCVCLKELFNLRKTLPHSSNPVTPTSNNNTSSPTFSRELFSFGANAMRLICQSLNPVRPAIPFRVGGATSGCNSWRNNLPMNGRPRAGVRPKPRRRVGRRRLLEWGVCRCAKRSQGVCAGATQLHSRDAVVRRERRGRVRRRRCESGAVSLFCRASDPANPDW